MWRWCWRCRATSTVSVTRMSAASAIGCFPASWFSCRRRWSSSSRSHLSFLPEKQTDFIFTTLAEEFGFVGGLGLLVLYTLIIVYGFAISLRSRNHFGRLLGLGIITSFFLYFFINTGMVMGLLP